MGEGKAVTKKLANRYRQATRAETSVVLEELVGRKGWRRDYARSALRQAGTIRPVVRRRRRTPTDACRPGSHRGTGRPPLRASR